MPTLTAYIDGTIGRIDACCNARRYRQHTPLRLQCWHSAGHVFACTASCVHCVQHDSLCSHIFILLLWKLCEVAEVIRLTPHNPVNVDPGRGWKARKSERIPLHTLPLVQPVVFVDAGI
jgi:hypothetical protein